MVTIKLDEHTAEHVRDIIQLQDMGVPDEVIQKYYDMTFKEKGDLKHEKM